MGKIAEKDAMLICNQFERLDTANYGKIPVWPYLMDHHHPWLRCFCLLICQKKQSFTLTGSRFPVLLFPLLYCLQLIWLHGAFLLLCTQILSLAPVCNYLFYGIQFGGFTLVYLMTICWLFSVLNVLELICMS